MLRAPWSPRALLGAAAIAGAIGCGRPAAPLVVFLGDSLTSGYRLPEREAYPDLVAQELRARGRRVRVVNAGRSGDTAAQGLARLPPLLALRPVVVVVALGTNDILRGLPLADAEAALDRILVECRLRGARVLLVGVRAPADAGQARVQAAVALYPRLAAAHRVPLVPDLLAGVAGQADLLLPDRLHPNAAGQQRLARNVAPALELLLAEVERD
jgi:acyl-CoA thioesterase-1